MPVSTIGGSFDLSKFQGESTRDALARSLLDLAEHDPKVVFVTPEGRFATGTGEFWKRFPNRAFDVGIAEQNAIGIAAGMATFGLTPVVGGYSCFLTFRGLEQLRNDIAYTNLNVIIVGAMGGIAMATGGSTHHATEDIATLRAIANMTVICSADGMETYKALAASVGYPGPVFIRLGASDEPILYTEDYDFRIGQAVEIREGDDATIIATGSMVVHAALASDLLGKEGLSVRVLNMHTIKPLDERAVEKACRETGRIVTVEEHNVLGGLGSAVTEVVTGTYPVPVKRVGIQDIFASIGPLADLRRKYNLTYDGIAAAVRELASK